MTITKFMGGLPNQSMPQAEFDAATGQLMADWPAWNSEVNETQAEMNVLATAAADKAVTASTKAGEASASAAAALTSKNATDLSAAAAHESEVAAAASAAASAASSAGITASSTTALTLTNGTKAFTVPAGKQFLVGVPMVAVSAGTPTAKAFGPVASYVDTTLTLTVTKVEGPAGTYSDWSISPAGAQGGTGGTAGGQLTGALDEKKGTAPASSATPDIWGAGGNYVPIAQTAAIAGFPNAPQPGAKRTLRAESSFPLVASANLDVHGGSTTINVGDELDVVADTVSVFRVTVRRNDGALASGGFHNVEILISSQVWTAKYTGPHKLTLIPAGGSGGAAVYSDGGFGSAAASGGSTGAMEIKTFYAVAGNAYTLTLGGPGAGVTASSSGFGGDNGASSRVAVPGNDAGDSFFSGNGLSVYAGGGKKGNATVTTGGTAIAAGALGGLGSGGDFNIPGSPSGTATAGPSTLGMSCAATGGAAVPYKGFPCPSGSATNTSYNEIAASGGAGVGGKSGDAIASAGASTALTAGAGYGGPSANQTATIGATGGAGIAAAPFSPVIAPLALGDVGSPAAFGAVSSNPTTKGAGTGAAARKSDTGSVVSGASTMLGGTGAAGTIGASSTAASGAVTYGGGSGGAVRANTQLSGGSAATGNGGAAFAIIETL